MPLMDPAQPSNDLVSRSGTEITEMKQGHPGEQTTNLQSHNDDLSANAEDHVRFRPLYKAVEENDWKGIEDFITKDPRVLTSKVNVFPEETVVHIVTLNLDVPFWLLDKLASMVSPESLEQLKDEYGRSALFHAATHGNTKAAIAFVRRNKDLPNIRNSDGLLPIHQAAIRGHKEIIQYLLSVTSIPLDDENGVTLIQNLINSGLYGTAVDLLKKYPKLAREQTKDRGSVLEILANKPFAFESGSRLGYWERLIYRWIPLREEHISHPAEDVDRDKENPIDRSKNFKKCTRYGFINLRTMATASGALCQKVYVMLLNALMELVPRIKYIHDTKLTHLRALEIVRIMCHDRVIWSNKEALGSLSTPVLTAAALGIYELVNEIMKAYFYSFTFSNKEDNDIFRLAILHRHEKVFSLVNKKNILLSWDRDMKQVADMKVKDDNILHLAGRLVPSSQVSGAALQMQRELQWFKAVESYVHPSLQEQRNREGKTPREVFTEAHKDLVKDGDQWMKANASSCTVVAALIITVVFAAAFTVPGGSNDAGIPNYLHKPSFIIFVISDALTLFSSTASVLMFLGILTTRYSEDDFLLSLPTKLIIGLVTLFFSIASTMVAFGATLYMFLSPWKWTIIPISFLGCVPVTLFALFQFPLLVEIFSSTYGTSIFQPKK